MSTPVSAIRNLGPAMEKSLAEVGIDSAEALRRDAAAFHWVLRAAYGAAGPPVE